MTRDQLTAARNLLLALHAQADQTPRLHGRRDAYRTALACIEIVQAAIGVPLPVRVTRPLRVADAWPPTEWARTQYAGMPVRGDTMHATLPMELPR